MPEPAAASSAACFSLAARANRCAAAVTSASVSNSVTTSWRSSQSPPAQHCQAILDADPAAADGVYWIDPDGNGSFDTLCDMTTNSGGWTLVMMVKSDDPNTLKYNSTYWATTALLNESVTDPTENQNVKNEAYNSLAFTEIRLDLSSHGNSHIVTTTQSSAHALFNGPYLGVSYSRTDYLNWIDQSNSSWNNQPHCNIRGFQVGINEVWKCRYGITMNNENACSSNDSAIGFGCHTQNYHPGRFVASGGFRWSPDTRYNRKGWIYVR